MKKKESTAEEKYLTGDLYKLKENVEKELESKYGFPVDKVRKGLLVYDSYNKEIDGENKIYYKCYYPIEEIELPKSFVEMFFTK